jgi:IS30 family transposase
MNLISWIKDKLWIKTITFDNWMEFAFHQLLKNIWIETYFCKPFHSREKWSIENFNRIIRRFYPKWTNFDYITEQEIEKVCNIIADSPREVLGFKTPNQVHFA